MLSILGAPLDSSASDRGEARAPEALRRAGLAERLGARDLGDVVAPMRDARRDPDSGVIGFAELREASLVLGHVVAESLDRGDCPLVLGGDCCLLLGVFAGLRRAGRDAGLWFVDGHADFYDGHGSPTGEAADMELAMLTGHGPPGLVDLVGAPPARPTEAGDHPGSSTSGGQRGHRRRARLRAGGDRAARCPEH